jgi:hypothetical protein
MPDGCGDDVELLQQLIGHGGEQAFSLVPMALGKVIAEKQWRVRRDQRGKEFPTFEAFVVHPLWWGLETTIAELETFCRKPPDVRNLIPAGNGARANRWWRPPLRAVSD